MLYDETDISNFAETLGKLFNGIIVNPAMQSSKTLDAIKTSVPHKLDIQNGSIILDVIITGHDSSNIKVKWNNETHVLKVVDAVDEKEHETRGGAERPWYYTPIMLEFQLPEYTDGNSFEKRFSNGVLTVTANYHEENPNKVMDVEI